MVHPNPEVPKNPASNLHVLNLIIALVAGLISIVGGVYSIKANYFTPKTGNLQGVVRDENIAKPLLLATVEISEINGGVIATLNTDSTGQYPVASLREGNYMVKASAERHQSQTKNIKIYANTDSTVSFDLKPEEDNFFSKSKTAAEPVRPSAAVPYYPPAPHYSEQNPNAADATASPRRNFRRHRMNSSYPTSGSDPFASPAGNTSDPGLSSGGFNSDSTQPAAATNPLGQVLTQTLGGWVQDWANKKAAGR